MLTVLVPAHNEGTKHEPVFAPSQLPDTIRSLQSQSNPVDRIIVIADNCTDDTVALALEHGVEVFETVNNRHKKGGALNQWLDLHLENMADTDLVMVMDADSVLVPDFVKHALGYIADGFAACGGVFLGKPGGRFVGMLQRNEYARYARDVERKRGRTLVLTGTATIFTAACLKHVVQARVAGDIPGAEPHVYDTEVLTEDNELTFALLHLGYQIVAPVECGLTTEVMETWRDLWRQRLRWKRGAIENNLQYGFTRITAKYWGLQLWGFIGILVTIIYLSSLSYVLATDNLNLHVLWLSITLIYMLERLVTVHRRGWKQMVLSSVLVIEAPYDLFLQAVHLKAFYAATFRTQRNW